ncbi:MAG: hypothetical protein JWM68_3670 [Verrucomicrobiales bacterium]|nr:hypothetical protein [Verrucomicrobiales bacterium]
MPEIVCQLSELKIPEAIHLPVTFHLEGKEISEYFRDNSGLRSSPLDITFDSSHRFDVRPQAGLGVDDWQLQDALGSLFRLDDKRKNPRVGVFLTDIYTSHPDAFGFMFDRDTNSGDYGPRQGCAIFVLPILNALNRLNTAIRDFDELVAYTIAHELGHAFNLWHVSKPSFLFESPDARTFRNCCSFVPEHAEYLRHASDLDYAEFILPGGTPFGSRGPLHASAGDDSFLRAKDSHKLRIHIETTHDEFHYFEPVELNVTLLTQEDGDFKVPDEIDPGYSSFAIWITHPNGERVRFHSTHQYCPRGKSVSISKSSPFRRDISIFMQKGRYTFPAAGRYRIQATLRVSSRVVIQSNTAECEVLPSKPGSGDFDASRQALCSPESIKFLRYKSRLPIHRRLLSLESIREKHWRSPSGCAIQYAIGRALFSMSERHSDQKRAHQLRHQGRQSLERAASHRFIGKHRLDVIRLLLEQNKS